jgi:hypothetical protein
VCIKKKGGPRKGIVGIAGLGAACWVLGVKIESLGLRVQNGKNTKLEN